MTARSKPALRTTPWEEPLRHVDLPLPEKTSPEALDWAALSWDLMSTECVNGLWTGMHFVLCPGLLLVRRCVNEDRGSVLQLGSMAHEYRYFENVEKDGVLAKAYEITETMLSGIGGRFEWTCSPFMYDFTADGGKDRVLKSLTISTAPAPAVETLGDAVRYGGENVADRVFNDIMFPRMEHLVRQSRRRM